MNFIWRSMGQQVSSERLGWELGWTMVYFLLSGVLIWAFSALIRRAIHSFSPSARYAVALSFLLLFILLAPACFLAVRGYPGELMLVGPLAASGTVAGGPTGDAMAFASPYTISQPSPNQSSPSPEINRRQRLEAAWQEFRAALLDERFEPAVSAVVPKLPWIWLVGSSLMLLYFSCGLVGAERLRRECDSLEEEEVGGLLRRLRREMGVSRRVAIGMTDRIAAPLVVGVLRPLVLLPISVVSSLSIDQLEFVLLHELAHVRRHDNLVNLLQRFVEAIAFFHPAAWRISAWVRLEREHCCDAAVMRHRENPTAYAETLASLAMPGLSAPYAVASLANHQLVSRVRHILRVQEPSMRISSKWFVATAMALLTMGGVVAVFAQSQEKTEPEKKSPEMAVDQTFTIELSVGKDGMIELQAAPNASYASVAELLKSMAGMLEKQGKHPEIKVRTKDNVTNWTAWNRQNCLSCHQSMPEHVVYSDAIVKSDVKDTCEPALVQWLTDATLPQKKDSSQPTTILGLTIRDAAQQASGIDRLAELRFGGETVEAVSANWAERQVVGPPNTFEYGDHGTAWASKTPDGQGEWLLLTYDAEVDVNGVLVHETFNPGAIVRVDAIMPNDEVIVLWSGGPKAVESDSPRLFFCKPKKSVKTARIRLTIASDVVRGWNEIDAVGILDAEGKIHWANDASASSTYPAEGEKVAGALLTTKTQVLSDDLIRARFAESPIHRQLAVDGLRLQSRTDATIVDKDEKSSGILLLDTQLGDKLLSEKTNEAAPSEAEKLKQVEAELEALQKQLDSLRSKLKPQK
jgi:beta-lactamase regulating signal transducer with metallopeptidase domain